MRNGQADRGVLGLHNRENLPYGPAEVDGLLWLAAHGLAPRVGGP
jgi:hypothetical protein